MQKQQGSVFGAAMLIAGCSIGAGMLGMPVVTRELGFIPSSVLFLICWLFMTSSGLILLEVALWFPEETNMAEMARKYLGRIGEWVTFGLMLFLMYALMTAYSAGAGQLLFELSSGLILPHVGSFAFVTLLFLALVLGTGALDWMNRLFMIGLAVTYVGLIAFGLPSVATKNLALADWRGSFAALPVLIVAFGFQNLVPSLVRYLDRDAKKVRKSIWIGTTIPLIIYLIWEFVILGLISGVVEGLDEAQMATSLIRKAAGGTGLILWLAEAFAFFAITTSFMGNALSVLDFLADQAGGMKNLIRRVGFSLLSVVPPLVFAYFNPDIFLVALSVAGSFSATLLFGLIPALMCFKGRKEEKHVSWTFPGKNVVLLTMIAFSLIVLIFS
jgi:tyrosine-specific transport protein